MAKIIGMNNGGGNTPPPKQPKIDLSKAKEIKCQNCGGTVFIPGTKFLKISKIVTGTPNDAIIPVELYLCGDCGEICQELLPKELKGNGN
jgi:DNA-directed RNA polymerase subunit RPC12/RpoP